MVRANKAPLKRNNNFRRRPNLQTRNPAAGGTARGADAEVQKARQLGESDVRKSKSRAPISQENLIGVYDGRERIGSIGPVGEHEFVALSLDGAELGRFRSLRAAGAAFPGGAA